MLTYCAIKLFIILNKFKSYFRYCRGKKMIWNENVQQVEKNMDNIYPYDATIGILCKKREGHHYNI